MPATKESFLNKVKKLDNGCWSIDVNCYTNSGYAIYLSELAHRVSYRLFKGVLIKGLVIDHICNNRTCVNPDHLQQITFAANVLKGIGPSAVNAKKELCIRGHSLLGGNLYIKPNGNRNCKACRREAGRAWSIRRKQYASD